MTVKIPAVVGVALLLAGTFAGAYELGVHDEQAATASARTTPDPCQQVTQTMQQTPTTDEPKRARLIDSYPNCFAPSDVADARDFLASWDRYTPPAFP